MDILVKGEVIYLNLYSPKDKIGYEQSFIVLSVWPNWSSACKSKGMSMDEGNMCMIASSSTPIVLLCHNISANSMLSMFEADRNRLDNQNIYELLMGNKKIFLDHVELVYYHTLIKHNE